jgi:hypothetical protein
MASYASTCVAALVRCSRQHANCKVTKIGSEVSLLRAEESVYCLLVPPKIDMYVCGRLHPKVRRIHALPLWLLGSGWWVGQTRGRHKASQKGSRNTLLDQDFVP